jgi:hypothetical protein
MLLLVAAEVKKILSLKKFEEIFQDIRFARHLRHYFFLNRQLERTTPSQRQRGDRMLNEMRCAVEMESSRIERRRQTNAALSGTLPGDETHPFRVLASILSITQDNIPLASNDEVRNL